MASFIRESFFHGKHLCNSKVESRPEFVLCIRATCFAILLKSYLDFVEAFPKTWRELQFLFACNSLFWQLQIYEECPFLHCHFTAQVWEECTSSFEKGVGVGEHSSLSRVGEIGYVCKENCTSWAGILSTKRDAQWTAIGQVEREREALQRSMFDRVSLVGRGQRLAPEISSVEESRQIWNVKI